MRVTFLSLYFWPDQGAVPRLLSELAEDCAAAGGQVGALTSRGSYLRLDERPLPNRENHHGVEIVRLWGTRFGRQKLAGRLCDYLTFLAALGLRLIFRPPPGILVCVSSPPMLAALVAFVTRLRNRRFVYKVEDVFPDLAIQLGVIRAGLLAEAANRLSRFSLVRAQPVVAIDQTMKNRLLERAPGANILVIPNWADSSAIRPDPAAGSRFRREIGLEREFLVLYSGNLGLAHCFEDVLQAARRLTGDSPRPYFLFIGTGPRRAEAERAAAGLENAAFKDFLGPELVSASHSAADLILITLRPEAEGLVVPSKFFSAIAAGKPILYVSGGNDGIAEHIRRDNLGWVVRPDPSEIVAAVRCAASDPEGNRERGRRARSLFLERFQRPQITGRWVALFRELESSSSRIPREV